MTYTEAARINKTIETRSWVFKDPKKLANGANEQWGKLEDGRYVLNKGCRTSDMSVLVGIPLQVLKNHFRLAVQSITADQWVAARKRFMEEEVQ